MKNSETNKINEEELRRRALELLAENAQKIAVINRAGGHKLVTDISMTEYSFCVFVSDTKTCGYQSYVLHEDGVWNEDEEIKLRNVLDEAIDSLRAEVARNRERADYVEAQLKTIEA